MLNPQPLFFLFFFPLWCGQDFGTPTCINPTEEAVSGSNSAENNKAKKERLRSLDTFRGSVILLADTSSRVRVWLLKWLVVTQYLFVWASQALQQA